LMFSTVTQNVPLIQVLCLHPRLKSVLLRKVTRFAGACDIDQIDAGPGGVTMEQFQRIYVQHRS
jgi:hypothetical protein